MKKIINRKLYDTETAEYIGCDSYSNPGDFNYWLEELYMKSNGEFFLYGEGGANSRYSKEVETNGWTNGWNITPMTRDEAQDWAEEHINADKYIEIFGEPEE